MSKQEREAHWRDVVKPVIDQYNRLITWGASNEQIRPFHEDMVELKKIHHDRFWAK